MLSDPPMYLPVRALLFDKAQYRDGVNNIPERTGFEYQYLHVKTNYLPWSKRSASRSGNPTSRILALVVSISYSNRNSSTVSSSESYMQ